MTATLLDGKALATKLRDKYAAEAADLAKVGVPPRVVSIQVAGDEASAYYVRNQRKQAEKCGIGFELIELPGDVSAGKLTAVIQAQNANPEVHGVILQVPLPKHLDELSFQSLISPAKDVEGINPANLGALLRDGDDLVPCTARAAVEVVLDAGIPIEGKEAAVVGRSAIVGKPLALMMLARNATVTLCHSRTPNLADVCRRADILMTAVGRKPGLVTANMIRPGATVVDIATIAKPEGGITGDVDFEAAKTVAGAITPVPGGVGPVTVMMLMRNTLIAARRRRDQPNCR